MGIDFGVYTYWGGSEIDGARPEDRSPELHVEQNCRGIQRVLPKVGSEVAEQETRIRNPVIETESVYAISGAAGDHAIFEMRIC